MRKRTGEPAGLSREWLSVAVTPAVCCAASAWLQWNVGSQIERAAGWFRTGMIYMISGVGGYMTSALFDPLQVSVGSNPSIFGLLAVILVELFQVRGAPAPPAPAPPAPSPAPAPLFASRGPSTRRGVCTQPRFGTFASRVVVLTAGRLSHHLFSGSHRRGSSWRANGGS